MKIGILSNVTMDFLKEELENYMNSHGMECNIKIGGFNQIFQEIMIPNSSMKKFDPEFLIVHLDAEEYLWKFLTNPFSSSTVEDSISLYQEFLDLLETAVHNFKNVLTPTPILRPFSTSLLEYNTTFSIKKLEEKLRNELQEMASKWGNIYVIDYGSLIEKLGWENIYDPKMFYLGSIRYNIRGFKEIARMYGRYIRAILGKIKKVLVLDADNVLWGGIIGEDGINGIKLGPNKEGRIYRDFQLGILNLYRKGIVLALNSRNNERDVIEVFRNHPHMVLREEHFAVMKINWRNKVENMKEISEELNLGLDSFVFIDDSAFEREMVKRELPEITVPEFPEDVARLPTFIQEIDEEYFPKINVTEEDKKRGEMYKAQVKRERLRRQISDITEYLRSLKMIMRVGRVNEDTIKRVAQLTQRTNQFNMTTRRYTEEDIRRMEKEGYRIYWMKLEDKFGDNGIVGVMIIKIEGEEGYIDTFLMSCRVIGRMAENDFMWYVEEEMMSEGVKILKAEYIPTLKNKLVENKYEELGFELIESNDRKLYIKDLRKNHINKSGYIKIENIS